MDNKSISKIAADLGANYERVLVTASNGTVLLDSDRNDPLTGHVSLIVGDTTDPFSMEHGRLSELGDDQLFLKVPVRLSSGTGTLIIAPTATTSAPPQVPWTRVLEVPSLALYWACLVLIASSFLFVWLRKIIGPLEAVARYCTEIQPEAESQAPPKAVGPLASVIQGMQALLEHIKSKETQDIQESKKRLEIVAGLAHDLRAPLTSIKGYVETLSQYDASISPEQRLEFLATIDRNCAHLLKIICDLLDLFKLDSAEVVVPEMFYAPDVLEEVRSVFLPAASDKGLTITVTSTEQDLMLLADRTLLYRAIFNLTDNAVRYTPTGGTITLAAFQTNEHLRLAIQDDGPGIPPEDRPHIFEQFYRGDRSRKKAQGGSGVGLAVCRRIAELHRGTISFETAQGSGTCFFLDLPLPHAVKIRRTK
jgi:signal transduction histidine kinase